MDRVQTSAVDDVDSCCPSSVHAVVVSSGRDQDRAVYRSPYLALVEEHSDAASVAVAAVVDNIDSGIHLPLDWRTFRQVDSSKGVAFLAYYSKHHLHQSGDSGGAMEAVVGEDEVEHDFVDY